MPYEVCHEFLSRKISRRLRVLYIKLIWARNSTFHITGESVAAGEFPQERHMQCATPTPRYNYIMDVEQVLKHLITYPSNSKLNKTRNVINSSRNHIKFRDQERRYRVFGTINMRFL